MSKTFIDTLNLKMSNFFKQPEEVEVEKSHMRKIREKDIFNNFVDQLKKSLTKYKATGEVEKRLSKDIAILFDTREYVRINTGNTLLDENQKIVSAIKVPKNEKFGVEIISHFRTEQHLRQPVRKLQRWLVSNEMPNVYVFSAISETGRDYVVVGINKNFNILYA